MGEERYSSSDGTTFRGAGNDQAKNRSGERGTVPGNEEQSNGYRSGERGTIKGTKFRGVGNNDSSYDIQISDSDQIGSDSSAEKLKSEQQARAIMLAYGIPQHFIGKDKDLLADWVTSGRTVGQLHRAVCRAKNFIPSPGPRYVHQCLTTIAQEDAGTTATSPQQPWYETARGISAKGAEYGIDESRYDGAFGEFRMAVMREAVNRNEPGVQDHLDKRREKVA